MNNIDVDGLSLQMRTNNQANLRIHDKIKFTVNNSDYIALNYYEAYPENSKNNFLSIALFKVYNGKPAKLLDKNIIDMGSPDVFESPFLFKSQNSYFIIFPRCEGKGIFYTYHIYRIRDEINEIAIDDYYSNPKINTLLKKDEHIYCHGPDYSFQNENIYGEIAVYKKTDPCCCPTRGKISFVYRYEDNVFKIVEASRH